MPAVPSPTAAFDEIASSLLTFYLNGTRVQLDASTVDPEASLLSFIRSQPGLTGTKLGCGEGGCGACTVVIQSVHPRTGEMQHLAINACLAPLLSVEGKHVSRGSVPFRTVPYPHRHKCSASRGGVLPPRPPPVARLTDRGALPPPQVIPVKEIGSSDNPPPLQERLWKLNGSQCGFCTPGIVMSIYALLRNAAYKGQLTVEDVELEGALDGNLCRCTGYAPIFMAVKSFCGDYLAPAKALNGSSSSNGTTDVPKALSGTAAPNGATNGTTNGTATPALSSGSSSSSSSSSTSPPSTPNGSEGDFVVPFNYDAAGLDKADTTCKSACCGKADGSAEMVSTDGQLFPPCPTFHPCVVR